jgi:molybdopterin-biosynthesis enzyme MoeA-like protein
MESDSVNGDSSDPRDPITEVGPAPKVVCACEAGVRLREARVIPDDPATIVGTVNEVRGKFDYVFTTGGIGPTHDDITSACIAEAFGVPLVLHPEAKRILETHYPPGSLNEARLRMAQVPEGASLLPNPISRAPGFLIENVYVLPGVPQIMQAIFSELKHRLRGGVKLLSRSVSCTLGEGTIAQQLAALQARYGDLEIGSYPYFRRSDFGVTLVVRGTERGRIAAAVASQRNVTPMSSSFIRASTICSALS